MAALGVTLGAGRHESLINVVVQAWAAWHDMDDTCHVSHQLIRALWVGFEGHYAIIGVCHWVLVRLAWLSLEIDFRDQCCLPACHPHSLINNTQGPTGAVHFGDKLDFHLICTAYSSRTFTSRHREEVVLSSAPPFRSPLRCGLFGQNRFLLQRSRYTGAWCVHLDRCCMRQGRDCGLRWRTLEGGASPYRSGRLGSGRACHRS